MSRVFEARLPGEFVTADTRAMAHETVDKQKRYQQITDCLRRCGPMTAKELAVELCTEGVIPSTERNLTAPRLTELSKRGVVEPIGKTKCRYTGKTVAVYGIREA